MKQYIDKGALVAEIERRKRDWGYGSSIEAKYKSEECDDILSFIGTLEVKEVDLEKEINNYISDNFFGSQTMGFFANRTKEEPNHQDIALCAKHFFELGIKSKGE